MSARVANILFLAGFVIYCIIRGVFQTRIGVIEKIDRRQDRADKILLFVVLVSGLLLPVIYTFTPLLSFAMMYFIRMPKEERMMVEHFGDGYREYMRETGRLWPRFGGRAHKAGVEVGKPEAD